MTEAALRFSYAGSHAEAKVAVGPVPAGPVLPHERIQLLDVLRGFALFGILQVNFTDWDGVLGKILRFTNDGSYYTTYSFLFGLGFAIQLIRAEERKSPFVFRYLWRSLLLFAIGAAHFVFIWAGDVVRVYGLLAMPLLLFHRARTRVLLAFAAALLLFSMGPGSILPPRGALLQRPSPELGDPARVAAARDAGHRESLDYIGAQGAADGEYGNIVRARAARLDYEVRHLDLWWLKGSADIFCMFLLGLVFGRARVFHEPTKHRALLIRLAGYGLVLGVVGNTFDTFSTEDLHGLHLPRFLGAWSSGLAYSIGNIALAFFYIASVTMLFSFSQRARRFLAPLAPVGRMGLTNYLAQSVGLSILLYKPGFGLNNARFGWSQQVLLIAFFVVQMWYSRWWFNRFQFGPVEWAWRSLTWFKMPPMRRAPVAEIDPATG